jgi:YD repeat-containing protein
MPEYAALITESRVREAIRTAVKSYEAHHLEKEDQKRPGDKEYFRNTIKPIILKIADDGTWQQGCSFSCFYTLTDRRGESEVAYHGLGLRLEVRTPDKPRQGFALPIIDLYYGRFAN